MPDVAGRTLTTAARLGQLRGGVDETMDAGIIENEEM